MGRKGTIDAIPPRLPSGQERNRTLQARIRAFADQQTLGLSDEQQGEGAEHYAYQHCRERVPARVLVVRGKESAGERKNQSRYSCDECLSADSASSGSRAR